MKNSGEYGGRVIREFKGDGTKFVSGAILKPEEVAHWPLNNRIALHKEGKIEWFGPPAEGEETARKSGSAAPKRGKVGVEGENAVKAPTTARRVR